MHEYAHYLTYMLAKEEMRRRVEEADRVRAARPLRRRRRSQRQEASLPRLRLRTEAEGR